QRPAAEMVTARREEQRDARIRAQSPDPRGDQFGVDDFLRARHTVDDELFRILGVRGVDGGDRPRKPVIRRHGEHHTYSADSQPMPKPLPRAAGEGAVMDVQAPEAVLGLIVVHVALRSEAAELVDRAQQGDDRTRLGRRARLLGRVVQVHHHGEDQLLWPALAERDPAFASIGEGFVAEHETLDARLAALVDVSRRAERDRVVSAAIAARDTLDAHLAAEEREALPVWLATFSPSDYEAFRNRLQRATPLGDVAVMVSWLLDRAQGVAREMVWNELPGALRALYRWRWRANFERTYGTTARPAVDAPPALRPRAAALA
ncbi:MAG: hypothetical protein QOI55_1310, partial [Actinomycetota bacterium]|nr:hypothetical protein [Actinomycetota bacterium]